MEGVQGVEGLPQVLRVAEGASVASPAFASRVGALRGKGASPVGAPGSPGASPTTAADRARDTRLREACQEMEAMLWSFLLRQMHEGVSTGKGLFDDGSAARGFREMLDGERAREMVRSGGTGLADMLYHELSRKEQMVQATTKGSQ